MQTVTRVQTVAVTSTISLETSVLLVIGMCVLAGAWCSRHQIPGRLMLFFGLFVLAFGETIPWCTTFAARYVSLIYSAWFIGTMSTAISVLGRLLSLLGLTYIVLREARGPADGAPHEEAGP